MVYEGETWQYAKCPTADSMENCVYIRASPNLELFSGLKNMSCCNFSEKISDVEAR